MIVGSLWAKRGVCGYRGRESEGERKKEREEERERRERVLWALGGNLCLAFEGWGSYYHSFVISRRK